MIKKTWIEKNLSLGAIYSFGMQRASYTFVISISWRFQIFFALRIEKIIIPPNPGKDKRVKPDPKGNDRKNNHLFFKEQIQLTDKLPPALYLSRELWAQFVFHWLIPLPGSSFERNHVICKPSIEPGYNDLSRQSKPGKAVCMDPSLGESADWYRNKPDFSWLSEFCSL